MTFAQAAGIADSLMVQYGALGLIIVGLVTALIYYVRQSESRQRRLDELQELRVTEAKEVNEKITTPMQGQIDLNKKTYDLLVELSLNLNKKRSR